MLILNLQEVKIKQFPNGESLIETKELQIGSFNQIVLKYEGDKDILHLQFLVDYIRNKNPKEHISLSILYMPYSRMDRTEGSTAFTLKSVANLINNMGFDSVEILEPHSDVTLALVDRAHGKDISMKILNGLYSDSIINPQDIIVFPDAGAQKRYMKNYILNNPVVVANKDRDFKTGYINSVDIVGLDKVLKKLKKGDKVKAFIIDDLCSKGTTFKFVGDALLELGKGVITEVNLIITHCEETIFDGSLVQTDSSITNIYTTNSIINDNRGNDKISILKLY